MIYLFRKELHTFFSNLTGYISIITFLAITGLFLWVLPGDYNITDAGYATLQPLFVLAPWLFLLLVPAITMRMFAEEKSKGTLDLLFLKPLSEWQIILAKYFAALVVVFFSILPTLVYMFTIARLSVPVNNIDYGGTWGSFIGLLFLASIYASIGLFCSALTENQVVAFIIAVVLSFFMYIGFESLGMLFSSGLRDLIINIGINEHYLSMSRGVIDSRDLIYFITANIIFLASAKLLLDKRKMSF